MMFNRKTRIISVMILTLSAILSTTAFGQNSQTYYGNGDQYYEQSRGRSRSDVINKVLRVMTVGLAYAQPLVADRPRSARKVNWATLGVAVACEVRECQNRTQYGYRAEERQSYGYNQNRVEINEGDPYGQVTNPSGYSFASNASSNVSSGYQNYTNQTDQPPSGLRSAVQWAIQRIRQIGGTIKNVRFRKIGAWKWECDIVFRRHGGFSDSYCRVRGNGVIEGL